MLLGVLVVGLCVTIAVAGLALVGRLVPLPLRESHNATIGTFYGALYVMYALIVGFSIYLVWSDFSAAQRTVESEAGDVEKIYSLAGGLPEPERRQIQGLAESYARAVVEEGWPLMEQGRESPRAGVALDELRGVVIAFEPDTNGEQALYAQLLTLLQDLDDERNLRLLETREGIPSILWVVLVIGGVATVAFSYLFGLKTPWLHMLGVAALTMILSLILFTIHALEYPFDGVVGVEPDAFDLVLRAIETRR